MTISSLEKSLPERPVPGGPAWRARDCLMAVYRHAAFAGPAGKRPGIVLKSFASKGFGRMAVHRVRVASDHHLEFTGVATAGPVQLTVGVDDLRGLHCAIVWGSVEDTPAVRWCPSPQ